MSPTSFTHRYRRPAALQSIGSATAVALFIVLPGPLGTTPLGEETERPSSLGKALAESGFGLRQATRWTSFTCGAST